MMLLSPSQESEDMPSSKNTWTSCNTSKTTLTRTSPTSSILTTSSELPKMHRLNSMPNTTMVSLVTQLAMIHKLIIQLHGLMLSCEPNDSNQFDLLG